jgi:hypothetical protein
VRTVIEIYFGAQRGAVINEVIDGEQYGYIDKNLAPNVGSTSIDKIGYNKPLE